MNPEEQSMTTNVLASFSHMLTQLVDQRIEMRMRQTLAGFANSEDFAAKVISIVGRMENNATMPSPDAMYQAVKSRLDVQIKSILNQVLRDAIQEEMQKPQSIDSLCAVIEDMVRNNDNIQRTLDDKAEEAADEWMDDSANTNRLLKNMDLEDAITDALRGTSLQITISD